MKRGRRPKPIGLHVIEGTLNVTRHRGRLAEPGPDERAAARPSRPESLTGEAGEIWDEFVAAEPSLTAFQLELLEIWAVLKMEFRRGPDKMPTPRIIEMRKLIELLLAPRGGRNDSATKPDPAARFFPDDQG